MSLSTCIRGNFIYMSVKYLNQSYTALIVPYNLVITTSNIYDISNKLILDAQPIIDKLDPNNLNDFFEIDLMGDVIQFTKDKLCISICDNTQIIFNNQARYIPNRKIINDVDKNSIITVDIISAETILVYFNGLYVMYSRSLDLTQQQVFYHNKLRYYYTIYNDKLLLSSINIYANMEVAKRIDDKIYLVNTHIIKLIPDDVKPKLHEYIKAVLIASRDPTNIRQIINKAIEYLDNNMYIDCKACIMYASINEENFTVHNNIMHIRTSIAGTEYHALIDKTNFNNDINQIYGHLATSTYKKQPQINVEFANGIIRLVPDLHNGLYTSIIDGSIKTHMIIDGQIKEL